MTDNERIPILPMTFALKMFEKVTKIIVFQRAVIRDSDQKLTMNDSVK